VLDEFKRFILRGNVLDLAVAVVIGTAFNAVVTAFVENVVMPIIGILGGEPTFDAYVATVNDSQIRYGTFLTALVSFLIIAASLFVIVRSFQKLQQLRRSDASVDGVDEDQPALTVSEELLAEIRDLLREGGTPRTRPPV
jgi:large conductance mechanosensitive channel